ncbi:MAG: ParA family protein [Gammaproteobacteria bacterium]|nr:ParA family protein [Gammaproteobacteria bacterium]
MRLFAVINQKGGVGKTTTVANLAYALAERGKQVTVIDLDPQGSLSASLGVDTHGLPGIDEVLLDESEINDVIQLARENLYLVPAGSKLAQIEQLSEGSSAQAKRLNAALKELEGQDFVFIDCPPASGFLVISALYAVEEVIIPVASEYLSLHGLSHLMGTFKMFEKSLGKTFKEWVVVTRFHNRRKLAQDVYHALVEHFPNKVLSTPIRETSALAESPSFGQTIFEYRGNSNGAEDYFSLATDLLEGRTL